MVRNLLVGGGTVATKGKRKVLLVQTTNYFGHVILFPPSFICIVLSSGHLRLKKFNIYKELR